MTKKAKSVEAWAVFEKGKLILRNHMLPIFWLRHVAKRDFEKWRGIEIRKVRVTELPTRGRKKK